MFVPVVFLQAFLPMDELKLKQICDEEEKKNCTGKHNHDDKTVTMTTRHLTVTKRQLSL